MKKQENWISLPAGVKCLKMSTLNLANTRETNQLIEWENRLLINPKIRKTLNDIFFWITPYHRKTNVVSLLFFLLALSDRLILEKNFLTLYNIKLFQEFQQENSHRGIVVIDESSFVSFYFNSKFVHSFS